METERIATYFVAAYHLFCPNRRIRPILLNKYNRTAYEMRIEELKLHTDPDC